MSTGGTLLIAINTPATPCNQKGVRSCVAIVRLLNVAMQDLTPDTPETTLNKNVKSHNSRPHKTVPNCRPRKIRGRS